MEQTNQTTQPEVTQPSQPTPMLMTTLMALVENYIKDIVQKQVAEIMLSHGTLRSIDDDFEKKIRDIAQDVAKYVVSEHNDSEYHMSEDDVTEKAVDAVNDFDFDDKINDAVSSAIDQYDFNDMIRTEIKDNITFSVSVD